MRELGLLITEFATDMWHFITLPITLVTLLEIAFIALAAYKNAIMDLIQPMDLLKSKGPAWSKAAMEANKDINHDGKVSWLEGSFPPDKWHDAKRDMIGFFGVANGLSFATCYLLVTPASSIYMVVLACFIHYLLVFVVFSSAFEIIYTYLKDKYLKNNKP